MARRVDLRIDREDVSVRTDDVAHSFRVARVFGVARTVGEPDLPGRIAEQGEVVVKLLGERAILFLGVEADP